MTSSSILTDLAGRCERSTTHDRQLGAEIICHVKGYRLLAWEPRGIAVAPDPLDLNPHLINIAAETAEGKFQFWAVDPTASLDAAMTLVPEGWRFIDLVQTETGQWHAGLVKAGLEVGTDVGAATASLAVAFACLRARAFQGG
jgi:hypothetical protein